MFVPLEIGVSGPGAPYSSEPMSVSRRGRVITIVAKTIDTLANPQVTSPSNGTVYTGDWYLCHPLNFSVQRLVLTSNKPQHSIQVKFQIIAKAPDRSEKELTSLKVIDDIRKSPESLPIAGGAEDLGAVFLRLTMEYNSTIALELYASLELLGSEVTN